MKLKDYQIPQYGLNDGLDQEDLEQYSLKNFDLKAYQLAQQQPDPAPMAAPYDPSPVQQETYRPDSFAAPQEAPSPNPNAWSSLPQQSNEPGFSPAANPVQTEPSQPALDPADVHFGPHFNLQTVSYSPLSPAQSWKIPRWVVTMVGLFFGSAAVLTLATCVVLLRDPRPEPPGPSAPPTAAVAATSAAPAASAPTNKGPADVSRVAPAPRLVAAVRHPDPVTANRMHQPTPGHRIVVSRHPGVVRRQVYGSRRVASKSTSSSVEPQETETASRRPPPDDLDKLLSESTL